MKITRVGTFYMHPASAPTGQLVGVPLFWSGWEFCVEPGEVRPATAEEEQRLHLSLMVKFIIETNRIDMDMPHGPATNLGNAAVRTAMGGPFTS